MIEGAVIHYNNILSFEDFRITSTFINTNEEATILQRYFTLLLCPQYSRSHIKKFTFCSVEQWCNETVGTVSVFVSLIFYTTPIKR